jgi:hypothetical protein
MGYARLYIWVEGPADVRFFEHVVQPLFEKVYDRVEVRPFAGKNADYLRKFLKSIKSMGAEYIFVRDINGKPCVTARKQILHQRYTYLEEKKIVIVVQEIESWYRAGLSDRDAQRFGFPPCDTTDNMTKEQLKNLILKRLPKEDFSIIDFMAEILKYFSLETATQKNKSFNYFYKRYLANVAS